MKISNTILAVLMALIALASLIGILMGKTHQAFIFIPALFITLLLIADGKKVTK